MSASHERAVRRSLALAQAAADAGDLRDALAWLDVVAAVDGGLPDTWEHRRGTWRRRMTDPAVERLGGVAG